MKPDSPIAILCEVLAVSRKGCHAWSSGQRARRSERDQPLAPTIHEAFDASWQTCGYPRLTLARCAGGEPDGKARVARLMRSAGLQGRARGALQPCTPPGNHAGPIAPPRLAKIEAITAINEVWQADITTVENNERCLHRAVAPDAFRGRIVGWAYTSAREADFVVTALVLAVQHRGRSP